jgi:hypothetical protein
VELFLAWIASLIPGSSRWHFFMNYYILEVELVANMNIDTISMGDFWLFGFSI